MALLLVALSAFVVHVQAFTQLDTTCTVPTSSVSFVAAPDVRGTLSILWSCLFTIFACTWTIQHLNVPKQRDRSKEDTNFRLRFYRSLKRYAKSFWSSTKWMLFTMIAPEIVLAKAFQELAAAKKLHKEIHELPLSEDEAAGWKLGHTFFLMMGGFRVIRENANDEQTRERSAAGASPSDNKTGDDPEVAEIPSSQSAVIETPPEVLYPNVLIKLRRDDDIRRLPNITIDEIRDKSKANALVKALAVMQVLWVCIEVLIRATRGLPISQLEVAVVAHSICAIITYLFYIPKPKDIAVSAPPISIANGISIDTYWGAFLRSLLYDVTPSMEHLAHTAVPNDIVYGKTSIKELFLVGMTIGGCVFGAVHVAGWNLIFPTPTERLLWRIASVLITALPPTALSLYYFFVKVSWWWVPDLFIFQVLAFVHCNVYIVARLFLLVETFRSLGFLPPGAFVSTWVSNVPFFG